MDTRRSNNRNPNQEHKKDMDLLETEKPVPASEQQPVPEHAGESESGDRQEPAPRAEETGSAAAGAAPGAELEELNDRHLRLAAEFENYKKRTARQWQERVQAANAELLYELLDIVDNFERALAAEHESSAYADGVRLIYDQLQALLARQGVEPIGAVGEAFDPAVHEALLYVESADVGEGRVCQEIRRGYRHHNRVLRPAQVAVSRGAAGASPDVASRADETARDT